MPRNMLMGRPATFSHAQDMRAGRLATKRERAAAAHAAIRDTLLQTLEAAGDAGCSFEDLYAAVEEDGAYFTVSKEMKEAGEMVVRDDGRYFRA